MKTVKVDCLPLREALELLEWQSERQNFGRDAQESEVEFIMHYRKSPYRKWLNTSSNTSDWKCFQTFTDARGNRLTIDYHKIQLSGSTRRSAYAIGLYSCKSQLRHWIVDRVLEMIEQPHIAKEMATQLIAWRKHREMLLNTTRSAVEMVLEGKGKLTRVDYAGSDDHDWSREYFEICLCITTIREEHLSFRIQSFRVSAFVEQLPDILRDLQMLQQLKRGKRLNSYHSAEWKIA